MTPTAHYNTVTKSFHWLTALIILTLIPVGFIANRLPYETNEQLALKAQLFSIHKTLGVIIFVVAVARIAWALTHQKPGNLHPNRKVETWLADLVHWLLYVSLVAVPLSGWIDHAATTGFAPILLPIGQDLPFVPKSESLAQIAASLHWIWGKIMVAAILLHVAGAFKHHLIDKDATLQRMWFGQTQTPPTPAHKNNKIAAAAAFTVYALATSAGAATGIFRHQTATDTATLEAVSSQWTVTEGSLGITITQFGSPLAGTFDNWNAAINFDPDATGQMGDVTVTIAIGSLTLGSVTDQAMGADFFDSAAFPTASFTATLHQTDNGYIADGTLDIKGHKIPTSLPFTLDRDGNNAVMQGAVTLDRRDFGVGESMGDETNIGFNIAVAINLTAQR